MFLELGLRWELDVTKQDDGIFSPISVALCYLVPYVLRVAGVNQVLGDSVVIYAEISPGILLSISQSLVTWY